ASSDAKKTAKNTQDLVTVLKGANEKLASIDAKTRAESNIETFTIPAGG
ncbi:MAG: hypothetical protein IT428_13865, partial [Planctomycetaceae bacterium]|nr:hypothetical protein [Planctomycetaceae bacterium]